MRSTDVITPLWIDELELFQYIHYEKNFHPNKVYLRLISVYEHAVYKLYSYVSQHGCV